MIKGVDVQGRGRWVNQCTPRLNQASLNQRERRGKGQIKEKKFLSSYNFKGVYL